MLSDTVHMMQYQKKKKESYDISFINNHIYQTSLGKEKVDVLIILKLDSRDWDLCLKLGFCSKRHLHNHQNCSGQHFLLTFKPALNNSKKFTLAPASR